jgi:hypothetical protein
VDVHGLPQGTKEKTKEEMEEGISAHDPATLAGSHQ